MGCILLRGVHVNECKQYMFLPALATVVFLIILFSQHVSASMGHPQVST
jgi:hypothetical protein